MKELKRMIGVWALLSLFIVGCGDDATDPVETGTETAAEEGGDATEEEGGEATEEEGGEATEEEDAECYGSCGIQNKQTYFPCLKESKFERRWNSYSLCERTPADGNNICVSLYRESGE